LNERNLINHFNVEGNQTFRKVHGLDPRSVVNDLEQQLTVEHRIVEGVVTIGHVVVKGRHWIRNQREVTTRAIRKHKVVGHQLNQTVRICSCRIVVHHVQHTDAALARNRDDLVFAVGGRECCTSWGNIDLTQYHSIPAPGN